MKIIGGRNKGKAIRTAKQGVRPTKAIVRAAVFNILQDKVIKASVLDVFAGSGALGIEALCRGAEAACFIENQPRVLLDNLDRFALHDKAQTLPFDFRRALKKLKGHRFDLIFLDPPYRKTFLTQSLRLIGEVGLLKSDGLIVAEHHRRDHFRLPENYRILKAKEYGETTVTFITNISGGTS
jgi:16S rRNA (guanine(966)-N(2))-methyltransferase RsmD